MNYNTNYWILDKQTGEKLFVTPHNSCFSSFVPVEFDDKKQGFAPGRKIEIIHEVSKTKASTELIEWWVKVLTDVGFPVTYEIKKVCYNRQVMALAYGPNERWKGPPGYAKYSDGTYVMEEKFIFDEDCYVWTLDFDEYSSKAQLKICCYLVRHLYELTQYKFLEEVKNYCEKYPEAEPFEVFQFMFQFKPASGHSLISTGLLINPITKEKLHNQFEIWKNKAYNNMESNEFQNLAFIKKKTVGYSSTANLMKAKYPQLKKDMSWSDYKEELNKIILENDTPKEVVDGEESEVW